MRILCPACQATYDVPDALVAPARKVRCAKCHNAWAPVPMEPKAAAPLFPDAEASFDGGFSIAEAMGAGPAAHEPDEHAETRTMETTGVETAAPALRADQERLAAAVAPRRRGGAVLALAWVASFALLGGLGYAGVAYREVIVRHWAPSARAYAMLHLVP